MQQPCSGFVTLAAICLLGRRRLVKPPAQTPLMPAGSLKVRIGLPTSRLSVQQQAVAPQQQEPPKACPASLQQGCSGLEAAGSVVQAVRQLPTAAPFCSPVTDAAAPGYSLVVSHPMDLGTVQRRLQERGYTTAGEARTVLLGGLLSGRWCTACPAAVHKYRSACPASGDWRRQPSTKVPVLVNKVAF